MNSKAKGNSGEREVRGILLRNGIESHRNNQMYIGGKDNPDVGATVNGRELHIECKRTERLNLPAAMRQAERDSSNSNAIPCVCHRSNRQPWLLTLHLTDFLDMLKGGGQ